MYSQLEGGENHMMKTAKKAGSVNSAVDGYVSSGYVSQPCDGKARRYWNSTFALRGTISVTNNTSTSTNCIMTMTVFRNNAQNISRTIQPGQTMGVTTTSITGLWVSCTGPNGAPDSSKTCTGYYDVETT